MRDIERLLVLWLGVCSTLGVMGCDGADKLAAESVDAHVDRDGAAPLAPDATTADAGGDQAVPDEGLPDAGIDADAEAPDAAPIEPLIPYRAECENLTDSHCYMPWPSDRWLATNPETRTGFNLAYDRDGLPANVVGQTIDPAPYAQLDGFSPSSQLMMLFPRAADLSGIGGPENIDGSLAPDFPTVVVDLSTGERLPHWIENDARADGPDEAALYIRPATRLQPNRAYGVAIRGLRDAEGELLPTPAGFAALRDGSESGVEAFEARRPGFEVLFEALAEAGVERGGLQMAWRFHTESLESSRGTLIAMRDDAVQRLGPRGLGCTVTEVDERGEGPVLRHIQGTITTPWYLDGPRLPAEIARGPDGQPMWSEHREVAFSALIPRSALEGPGRLVHFGHGLFGEARGSLRNGGIERSADALNTTFVGTDWAGMSSNDLGFLATALADTSRFWFIGQMLQQGVINHISLMRSMLGVCQDDPAFQIDGRLAYDPERRGFFGISQGSILGGALVALHPDIDRAVLAVGGSSFSFMIERSIHYDRRFEQLLTPNYPRRIDEALLMAAGQHVWDRAESATWLRDVNRGVGEIGPRAVLYLIAENDAQVHNLSSGRAARLAGFPVLDQSTHIPWGTEVVASPHEGSGYLAMDLGDRDTPTGNRSPQEDDGGHSGVSATPEGLALITRFYDDGIIEVPCEGPCVLGER